MYPLLFGLLLDLLLGDPRWALHPIRLFGQLIAWGERWLNHPPHQKAKGTLLALTLVLGVWAFFYAVEWLLADYRYVLLAWQTIFFFFAICPRSLIGEALAVERYVVADDLEGARKRLSWIVGRDTSQLTFAIEATDQAGVVAQATHERFIVSRQRFLERLGIKE